MMISLEYTILLAIALSCLISYVSAFLTFSMYFKDSFFTLFISWEVQLYSLISGAFALLAFQAAKILNITVSNISFNDYPFLMAMVVGIAGHKLFISLFKSKNELNSAITKNFNDFFDRIQSFLFHQYAVRRNMRIRNEVAVFLENYPYDKLNELSLSCQIIAKEINEDDNERLIKVIKEIMAYGISNESKVINIGVELSKYLGVKLIKQIALEVNKDTQLLSLKETVTTMIKNIKMHKLEVANEE